AADVDSRPAPPGYCPVWNVAIGQLGAAFHRLPTETIGCGNPPATVWEQETERFAPREEFSPTVIPPNGTGLASSRTAAKYVLPPLAESGPAIELPVIIA